MDELIETKKKLYWMLLKKDLTTLTDQEVNIMHELSKDRDVQGYINAKAKQF